MLFEEDNAFTDIGFASIGFELVASTLANLFSSIFASLSASICIA